MKLGHLAALFLLGLSAFAAGTAASAGDAKRPEVEVVLTRDREAWVAQYHFNQPSPVWFFPRTSPSLDGRNWRLATYRVETPGVRLVRVGVFDALVSEKKSSLTDVRIAVTPFSSPLVGDYLPVVDFSDGGLAFYTGHFSVSPAPSVSAVLALTPDVTLVDRRETFKIVDPQGRVLINGRVQPRSGHTVLHDDGVYVYAGRGALEETSSFSQSIDPGLPSWAREDLVAFLPKLMTLYTEVLGPRKGSKPAALVAYGGSAKPGYSQNGSVLEGMVVLSLSGAAMSTPNPAVRNSLIWIFGHETSHFWLGQNVRYERLTDNWITEGGADYLSLRAIKQLEPSYDIQKPWQGQMDDCLARIGPNEALASAHSPDKQHAVYSCGALLSLAATSAAQRQLSSGDDFIFIKALLQRSSGNGVVNERIWLDTFALSAGSDARTSVEAYLDQGVANPVDFWADLFSKCGVGFERTNGRIVLAPGI